MNKEGLNHSEAEVGAILRGLGEQVIAQSKIGRYTVDFLLPRLKVIVEVDGKPYHTLPEDARHGQERDKFLQAEGYLPIHVWTSTLHEEGGTAKIRSHIIGRMYRDRGIVLRSKSGELRMRKLYRKLGYDPDAAPRPSSTSPLVLSPQVSPSASVGGPTGVAPAASTILPKQERDESPSANHE